jgi:tetratricopeptide (TPR) repeat protein
MSEEVSMQYNQAAITPFWNKLPFIFSFPFRTGPLIFMVCVVAASGLAGLVLGDLGLVFKGTLIYLGLRYGFNVLELFAKGRFEGQSVDHRLWGPEKRPAKLGLVLVLFISAALTLGNYLLDSQIAKNTKTQERLIAHYNAKHAKEIEARQKAIQDYEHQLAMAKASSERLQAAQADSNSNSNADDDSDPADQHASAFDFDIGERPENGPTREEILQESTPKFGDPLWFKLMPAWYWLLVIVASLVLPSATIVIALEDKFFKSLNPGLVLYFIQSIGSAYFVLWAFFLAIAGTRQAVLAAGSALPEAFAFPMEMALATYLGLVLFALMGYTLYQFHQELHLDVDVDFDDHRQAGGAEAIAKAGSARAALQAAEPDPLERKLQALVKTGNYKEAIAELKDQMRYDKLDPVLNTRLHALYADAGDPAATLAHGQQWLSALARAKQGKQSVQALRKLMQINPDFVVDDGDVILPAAQTALSMRDAKLAFRLLKGFDKRFPQHPDLPAVFFLGAKMMSEHMQQHEKAADLIRSVIKRYPDHAVAAEAQAYLGVLKSMPAPPAAAPRNPPHGR